METTGSRQRLGMSQSPQIILPTQAQQVESEIWTPLGAMVLR